MISSVYSSLQKKCFTYFTKKGKHPSKPFLNNFSVNNYLDKKCKQSKMMEGKPQVGKDMKTSEMLLCSVDICSKKHSRSFLLHPADDRYIK